MSYRTRLAGSGRIPRILAWSSWVVVALSAIAWTGYNSPGDWPIVLAFVVPATYFAIRSLFIGVWRDGDAIDVVTWFTKARYALADLRRCDAVPYWGLLTRSSETSVVCMLQFTKTDDSIVARPGTVSTRRQAVAQARTIRAAISAGRDAPQPS